MTLDYAGPAPADLGLEQVLEFGRGSELPDGTAPVHDLFRTWARQDPGAVAVIADDGAPVTYRDLDVWSARIAHRLGAAGVGSGSRVALLFAPSAAMIAAALGVLRSGAAYVPLDPANPPARLATMLADADVQCILADTSSAPERSDRPVIEVERYEDGPCAAPVPVTGSDPAYLIYTSGSTGEPKGVVVEHDQLTASTLARRLVYPGSPVYLLVSPLAFDSSVAGVWGTLTAGGCLVVAGADDLRDPQRLLSLVSAHRVTRLLCVPGLYQVLLDAAERFGRAGLASLDTVVLAGEVLPEALLRRHFEVLPATSLVNEYGPTEAAVWASYRRFSEPGPVTIGGPIPGSRLYVLDGAGRPVACGVDGELHIGGAGVARGYLGRPEATAEAFLADPFTGGRMYRTGDVVRWTGEGTLEFRGRRDYQVKIRGHRVELGAIETQLRMLPGIRDAVVVAVGERLVGLVETDGATTDISGAALRAELGERLPGQMVPSRIEVRQGFPRTLNGKVDRSVLAADVEARPADPATAGAATAGADVTGPRPAAVADSHIRQVTAAWTQVLDIADVPEDVNFFDLGGNSLTMFKLQDALESHTGSRPSIVSLFRHTTVSAQVALLRDGGDQGEESTDRMRAAAQRRASAMRARRVRAERAGAR